MAKITSFDKTNLKQIRQDLDAAIDAVCKKYGMNPTGIGNIRFTADSFSTKIDFNLARPDFNPQVVSVNPEQFIGRKFKQGQRTFTIESIDSRTQKLVGRTNRGKGYLLTPSQLLLMREVRF